MVEQRIPYRNTAPTAIVPAVLASSLMAGEESLCTPQEQDALHIKLHESKTALLQVHSMVGGASQLERLTVLRSAVNQIIFRLRPDSRRTDCITSLPVLVMLDL